MCRNSSTRIAVLVGLCFVGCGVAAPPAPTFPAGPPVATTPADGGWVTFEFPGASFTVECPIPPRQDRSNELFSRPDELPTTIYRASAKGYEVSVIVGIVENMVPADVAGELITIKNVYQELGGAAKDITQAGLSGVETTLPARDNSPESTTRHLYRDGMAIMLQFTLFKTGNANVAAADRERFFNSFKLKLAAGK